MTEMQNAVDHSVLLLTPRQDRIEKAILAALRNGAPRSALRDEVRSLAQLLRMQGHSAERAAAIIGTLGQRAAPLMPHFDASAAGDALADRLGMMLRWSAAEFSRSD
jgi:hypothetical protein